MNFRQNFDHHFVLKLGLNLTLICGLILLASCKKGSSSRSEGLVINKTYWEEDRINTGFDLHIGEDADYEDDDPQEKNHHYGFYLDERNALEEQAEKWDALLGTGDHISVATTTNKDYADLAAYQDGELGIYTSRHWFESLGSSALAITQYFGVYRLRSTGEIWLEMRHADIIFNYRDFKFSIDDHNSRPAGVYDLSSIGLHELGHFWGLQHTSNAAAVMYPSIGQGVDKRDIQTPDKRAFKDIYEYASNTGLLRGQLITKGRAGLGAYDEDVGDEEIFATIPEEGYDIGPLDDDDTLYRFVIEHRADGTSVVHPAEKFIPQCGIYR